MTKATARSVRLRDLLPIAWGAIRRNRLRSGLTTGAVAVSIGVLVYLVSLGYGLEGLTLRSVEQSSSLLTLNITSPKREVSPLTPERVEKIASLAPTAEVLPQLTLSGFFGIENRRLSTTVVGVDGGFFGDSERTRTQTGTTFRTEDEQVAVVSTQFLRAFQFAVNKTPGVFFSLELDADDFPEARVLRDVKVVGTVEDDAQIAYVPRQWLEDALQQPVQEYQQVKLIVAQISDLEPTRQVLIANGFRVTAAADSVDEIRSVFRWIRIVLLVLGLVAVAVAAIGMFNTLTISLLERTREVGIMKALGARNRDVSRIFLLEAALLGAIGGVIGLGLAWGGQQLTYMLFNLLAFLAQGTVPQLFEVRWWLPTGAFAFALFLALATGFYPARRAGRLRVIDAIRYE